MAKMRIPLAAAHLSTIHAMREIAMLVKERFVYRTRECRPSAARLKFIRREEKRLSGDYIHIYPGPEFSVILIQERPLGEVLTSHSILQWRQTLAQLSVIRLLIALLVNFAREIGRAHV